MHRGLEGLHHLLLIFFMLPSYLCWNWMVILPWTILDPPGTTGKNPVPGSYDCYD